MTSIRSTRTGPGSRGGTTHLPGERAAYQRRWRAASPEYREREMLRCARSKAVARGDDPTLVFAGQSPARLTPAVYCACECGCREITVCGFCREGLH